MIYFIIFLILLSILLIGHALGYKQLVFSLYSSETPNLGIHWNTKKCLERYFPIQYKAGYIFMLGILIYKLRIGITLK